MPVHFCYLHLSSVVLTQTNCNVICFLTNRCGTIMCGSIHVRGWSVLKQWMSEADRCVRRSGQVCSPLYIYRNNENICIYLFLPIFTGIEYSCASCRLDKICTELEGDSHRYSTAECNHSRSVLHPCWHLLYIFNIYEESARPTINLFCVAMPSILMVILFSLLKF